MGIEKITKELILIQEQHSKQIERQKPSSHYNNPEYYIIATLFSTLLPTHYFPFYFFCKHPQNIKFPHTNKQIILPKTTTSRKRRNFFFKLQKSPCANHENHFY